MLIHRWLIMLTRNFFINVFFILLSISLVSCGGESSNIPTTKQGVFLDSAVSGLTYTSPSYSGITDANGTYDYKTGETITFSIGGIIIGSAIGATTLTPVSLVPTAINETHPSVVNITRFLLSLDEDNDPNNGIDISQATRDDAAALSIDFSPSITDFEIDSDLVTALNILTSSSVLVTSAFAQEHLRSTILNAYAGTYNGAYTGDDSGNWQVTVNSDGSLSGNGISAFGGNFGISGSFNSSGEATLTQGGTTSGATFSGTVDFDGSLSGLWDASNNTTGTFTGTKQ